MNQYSETVDKVYNEYKNFCLPGVPPDMVNVGPRAIAVAGEGAGSGGVVGEVGLQGGMGRSES